MYFVFFWRGAGGGGGEGGGPHNEDYNMLGYILASPILGNYHIHIYIYTHIHMDTYIP